MFLCDGCAGVNAVSFFKSYGQCQGCGKIAGCTDTVMPKVITKSEYPKLYEQDSFAMSEYEKRRDEREYGE